MLKKIGLVSLIGFLPLLAGSRAQALQVTGATLTNFSITAETLQSAGVFSGTTIQFTLASPADVTIDIQATSSSQTIATLSQNFATGGAHQIFWNALWPIGNDLGRQNGNYTLLVVASSGTDFSSALINSPPLSINSIDIHNLVITPSFDANQNTAFPYKIQYALAKEAYATVQVKNSSDSVVRTLVPNKLQSGEAISSVTVTWNGLDDAGNPVSLGLYKIAVNAKDTSNDTATTDHALERTQTIVVQSLAGAATDPQKLFEDNVYVYPNPVRNGLGTFNVTPVRDGASIKLKIYTMTGDLVLDKDITGDLPFLWHVTNQSGQPVGRGLYYYVVREEDSQGTLQTVKKMAVLP